MSATVTHVALMQNFGLSVHAEFIAYNNAVPHSVLISPVLENPSSFTPINHVRETL
jgi:hypothetical protein